jgi:mono/diheme cytochrome c family protein
MLLSWKVSAQDTPDYYRQNCMNCHTIGGGRLTGPDLKDVTKRKMTRYRAEQILKLIEAESKLEKSQFQGLRISDKPFTESDRIAGRELFLGKTPLANGGTACIACHSMYDLPALGGGRLGPDLTRVYERLKGRQSLSAWLMAPATETMQPIFKNHPLEAEEIHQLTAYFEAAAPHSDADASVNRVAFLLWGLALAAAMIFGFDAIWKTRFHGVRQPLVEAHRRNGTTASTSQHRT